MRSTFKKILLAVTLSASAAFASAETLRVEIDTSGLAQQGWIDLMFNAPSGGAAASTAQLSNFVGFNPQVLPELSGEAGGSLGAGYTMGNLNGTADIFHAVNLGGKIGFDVDFSGAIGSVINRSLSTLSVALYGADQTTLLGNGDPASGALVQLYWLSPTSTAAGSVSTRIFDSVASVSPAGQISPVPEPSVWLTMGAGLGLLALVRRRRQRSATFAPA